MTHPLTSYLLPLTSCLSHSHSYSLPSSYVLLLDPYLQVGLQDDELSLFAGEQLALLTNNYVHAALHRVPAPDQRGRLAMPFFVRSRP